MWILVIAGVVLVDAQGYNYPRPSAALSPNQYNYQIAPDRNNANLYTQNQYNNQNQHSNQIQYNNQNQHSNQIQYNNQIPYSNQYSNQQTQYNGQTPQSAFNHDQYSTAVPSNNPSNSYHQQTYPTNQQSVYTEQSSNSQQAASGYKYNVPQPNGYTDQQPGQTYVSQASNYNQPTSQNHQQVSSNYNSQGSPLGQANSQPASYSYKDNSNIAPQNYALNALQPAYPQSQTFGSVLHQPVVTKHIYFHIPPADIEEPKQLLPPTPTKKNYKIIFIKVPSQESRSRVLLQQKLQEAAIEEKTLIYVLVKKPEAQEKAVETVTTKPEVFYVKYNHKTALTDVVGRITE